MNDLTRADRDFLADVAGRALTFPGFIDQRVAAEAVPMCRALRARLLSRRELTQEELTDAYGLLEVGVQEDGFFMAEDQRRAEELMGQMTAGAR